MRVACVLRSGGEYRPEHVERLLDGVSAHLPGAKLLCLSDVAVPGRVPLLFDWPGWWSKMELFRPDIEGDLLYIDIDTVLVGGLADIAAVGRLTLLRDFYRRGGLGSGLMYLPAEARRQVWAEWFAAPARWMRVYRRGGDQAFLERHYLRHAVCWQHLLPGQVVSWKVHCREGGLPADARVVCFHGRPRPWHVGWLQ